MLETPDYPALSRVMRVQPRPDEKPASGFSWGDYEDVNVMKGASTDAGTSRAGAENDADGEGDDDNDGWGVVKSRKPSRSKRASFFILTLTVHLLQNQHGTHPLKVNPTLNPNRRQNNPNVNAKTRPNAMLKKLLKHLQNLSG